jgi:hypothetical protein
MLGMLTQFLETLLNSGVLVPAIWLSLGLFIAWFLLSAQRSVVLSPEEAEMLWKIHKRKAQCKAKEYEMITHRGKTTGFKCKCGHKHIQKKHLITVSV